MDIPELQQLYLKNRDIFKDAFFKEPVSQPEVEEVVDNNKKDTKDMSQGIDLQSLVMPRGGYDGGMGLGGGLIGGVLLGALLSRGGNGLFGGNSDNVSGLNNLQGAIDTNAVLTNLADIKAAVPLAESQVQLALAGSTADINNQNQAQSLYLGTAINNARVEGLQAEFEQSLSNQKGFCDVTRSIDAVATEVAAGVGCINSNIDKTGWALSREISNDGEKTRALINQIDRENLNRLITTQANEITELRHESNRERDRHGVEITMTNNQNQNQLQFQQQAQAINSLVGVLGQAIQSIRSTNSAINVGGTQLASPTNTNTNIH